MSSVSAFVRHGFHTSRCACAHMYLRERGQRAKRNNTALGAGRERQELVDGGTQTLLGNSLNAF